MFKRVTRAIGAWFLLAVCQAAEPGVVATFTQGDQVDYRVQRMVALFVPDKESPTPFLAPDKYTVEFSGLLNLEARSRLYFSFAGRGKATLTVNGEVVLETAGDDLAVAESSRLRLNPGLIPVTVLYEAPADGDAEFRLYWRGREFQREVIPPKVWQHEPDDATAHAGLLRTGRELFALMKCTSCHLPEAGYNGTGMPELLHAAPSLKLVAASRRAGWVNAWLKEPRALRPQARMPHMFQAGDKTEDVTAWVMSLGEAVIEDLRPGDKESGAQLFRDAGCIACHVLPGEAADESGSRIPLKWTAAKFNQGALAEFLGNPALGNPHTRMPDFGFTDKECSDLAAFVLSLPGMEKIPSYTPGEVAAGAVLAKSSGCINCHSADSGVKGTFPALTKIAGTDWLAHGCVAGVGDRVPMFFFTEYQKKALAAFGGKPTVSLTRAVPAEYADRTIRELNCAACHMIDGRADARSRYESGLGDLVKNVHEEGTYHVDQARPSLTYAGEKLNAEWTRKLLNGELAYKPREYLAARMPAWKSRSELLSTGMAHLHGVSAAKPEAIPVDKELEAAGRKLVGVDGGFACQTCHAMGDAKAIAMFEVAGNNLAHVSDRLRYEYYKRWMHNPMRVNPSTKMPQFIPANGPSPMLDILGGDGAKQIEAVWHWLQAGKQLKAPPGP